jgi:nucleotide-binding universal stress UspA family protein
MAKELEADVIAMATHGYGGVRRTLLGSVADKLLRISPLPVLIARPQASA